MKIRIFLFLIMICQFSHGFQAGENNLNFGIGSGGSRGIVGASWDRFIDDNQAMSFGVGIDFVGAVSSLSYRYFSEDLSQSNQIVFGRCFFVVECKSHIYGSIGFQYAGASQLIITEGADQRTYEIASKNFALVGIGLRNIFKNNLTIDFEILKRKYLSGGSIKQTSGTLVDETDKIQKDYDGITFGLAMGFLF